MLECLEQIKFKSNLTGVEWVHCLFLFPLVLGKNVVVTCKLGSFLCSSDNLLQKNIIGFFFENQISKWHSFEKRILLAYFYIFSYQGKLHKFLQLISHSHTYMYFAHPIDFFALPILKKIRTDQVRFLFSVSPGVNSYSRHFGTINK